MDCLLTDFASRNTGVQYLDSQLFRGRLDLRIVFQGVENVLDPEVSVPSLARLNALDAFQLSGEPHRQRTEVFLVMVSAGRAQDYLEITIVDDSEKE